MRHLAGHCSSHSNAFKPPHTFSSQKPCTGRKNVFQTQDGDLGTKVSRLAHDMVSGDRRNTEFSELTLFCQRHHLKHASTMHHHGGLVGSVPGVYPQGSLRITGSIHLHGSGHFLHLFLKLNPRVGRYSAIGQFSLQQLKKMET